MKKMSSLKHTQAGVTLVELMIGLTVGLVVTGGAMTILFGNQKMLLEKGRLDRTQEEFRFATTTITRLVRQANSFSVPNSNDELVINFDSSQRDCLGVSGVSTTNKLKLENNQLLCIRNNEPDKSHVLAKNIGNLQFSYGIQKSGIVAYTPYFKSDASVDPVVEYVWNDITSVQTKIGIAQDGLAKQPALEFIATSHQKSSTASLSSGGESQLTEEELKKLLEEEAKADKKAEDELKGKEAAAEEAEAARKEALENLNCIKSALNVKNYDATSPNGKEFSSVAVLNMSWSILELETNKNTKVEPKSKITISLASSHGCSLTNWKIDESGNDKNNFMILSTTTTFDFYADAGKDKSLIINLKNGQDIQSTISFKTP